jgi:hypothetical protein
MFVAEMKDFIKSITLPFGKNKSMNAAKCLACDTVARTKEEAHTNDEGIFDLSTPGVSNASLLAAFNKMDDDDKILLLQTALLAHKKVLASGIHKQLMERDLVLYKLRAWVAKALIAGIGGIGLITISAIAYLIIKNLTGSEMATIAALIKSLEEIIRVIFFSN